MVVRSPEAITMKKKKKKKSRAVKYLPLSTRSIGIFVTSPDDPLLRSIGILVTFGPISSKDILSASDGRSSVLASNE